MSIAERAVGAPVERIEGREKVTGEAVYAFEHAPEGVAYAAIVASTVARGMVTGVDAGAALSLPGVLGVLSAENAPSLPGAEGELAVLQSPAVAYRGEIVAAVVAETLETARQAAELVRVDYDAAPHDVLRVRATRVSTHRTRSTRTTPPTPKTATSTPPWPPPRCASTRPTRPRPSTTTRWSRTPPSPSGRATG